ncbi:unnamed protein product, partial [Rotaria sp. Silwood1]
MNIEKFRDTNVDDTEVIKLIDQAYGVIFGSLEANDDEELETVFEKSRTHFVDEIQHDAANSSHYYYVPEIQQTDPNGWLESICGTIEQWFNVKISSEKLLESVTWLPKKHIVHVQHY